MTWFHDFADSVMGKAPRPNWNADQDARLEAYRERHGATGELIVTRDKFGWWFEPQRGDRLFVHGQDGKPRKVRVVGFDKELGVMEVVS